VTAGPSWAKPVEITDFSWLQRSGMPVRKGADHFNQFTLVAVRERAAFLASIVQAADYAGH
jgi:hypothetical protein